MSRLSRLQPQLPTPKVARLVTPPKFPKVQSRKSLISSGELKYCQMLTNAKVIFPTIKPIISNATLFLTRKEMSKINPKTKLAPAVEAKSIIQLSPKPNLPNAKIAVAEKPESTTIATPKLAPAVIPNTEGPANGFRNNVCICKPANDNAPPAKIAVMAFGNRIFQMIPSQARFSFV